MNRITIELWLWLGEELKGDFELRSEMCSAREEVIEEGISIGDLLTRLADRYHPIAQKIFDKREKRVCPNLVVTYNDRVISPHSVLEQVLKDGDKITIIPMYTGG